MPSLPSPSSIPARHSSGARNRSSKRGENAKFLLAPLHRVKERSQWRKEASFYSPFLFAVGHQLEKIEKKFTSLRRSQLTLFLVRGRVHTKEEKRGGKGRRRDYFRPKSTSEKYFPLVPSSFSLVHLNKLSGKCSSSFPSTYTLASSGRAPGGRTAQ